MGIRTNVGEIKFRDADGTFQPLPIVSGTVSGGISEEDLKKIHKEITQEEYDNLVNANQVEDDVVYFIKDSYDSTADEEIPAGADLNDYTTPGIYLVTSSENASEIANLPVQAMGFLVVKRTNSTSALQTYHVAYSHGQMIHDTSRGAE